MRCYLVTFHCCDGEGIDIVQSFYAENTIQLAEEIMEYEEDLEGTSDMFVVSKDIKQVDC
jgi:hypothetical protein